MRWIFWTSTAAMGGVVFAGLSRNAGNKFVRTLPQQGCLFNYANVADSTAQLPPELICCTGRRQDEGVCTGGRSPTTKVLTTKWAFVIPLVALAVNAICDWLAGGATAARRRARRNRFFLYSAIMLIRTLALYFGLGYVQELVQAEESRHCWYAHLRRSGRCSEHFDFADHVVLGVCQYFVIQVFELSCIVQEYRDFSSSASSSSSASASASASSLLPRKQSPAFSSSSSSASTASSSASHSAFPPPPPPPPPPQQQPRPSALLCVLPTAVVCVAVAGAALLLVYDTAAFFHSRAETAVALAISWFVVGSPLLSLMGGGVRGGVSGGGAWGRGRVGPGGAQAGTPGGWSPCRGVFLAPY